MWWKLQVPGTVSTNSYQGFRFSLTATISSLMIVRKAIPSMGDLQYSLTAQNIKIWLLTNQVPPLIINQLSATNPVAGRFPMACCKKSPCYISVQIWLGVATVQKGLTVLVLPSTAVTKIVNTFDLEQILLDVKHDYSQQLLNETGVILQIIRNDAQWDVMKYTILLEIYHHRTGCMVQSMVFVAVISIPGFHPGLHSDKSKRMILYISLISSFLFAMKVCVVRLSTQYTSN